MKKNRDQSLVDDSLHQLEKAVEVAQISWIHNQCSKVEATVGEINSVLREELEHGFRLVVFE